MNLQFIAQVWLFNCPSRKPQSEQRKKTTKPPKHWPNTLSNAIPKLAQAAKSQQIYLHHKAPRSNRPLTRNKSAEKLTHSGVRFQTQTQPGKTLGQRKESLSPHTLRQPASASCCFFTKQHYKKRGNRSSPLHIHLGQPSPSAPFLQEPLSDNVTSRILGKGEEEDKRPTLGRYIRLPLTLLTEK